MMNNRWIPAVVLLALQLANCRPIDAQDELSSLLSRLKSGPVDQATLGALEERPLDPRTVPALRVLFDGGKTKRDKQLLAITLIHLGEQSDIYFEFLAQHARKAIEDRTPSFLNYDAAGKTVRGSYPAVFVNWCAQNGKAPKVVEQSLSEGAMDVLLLAWAQDAKAIELFFRGLDSPQEFVILYSIEGLGRLQVSSAIPKIAELCARLPKGATEGVGRQLAWFSDIRAYELMQRVVPDGRLREFFREGVAGQRKVEIERALRRSGRAPAGRK